MKEIEAAQNDFPAARNLSYLNTGTVAMMPAPVMERLIATMRGYNERGPALPEGRDYRNQALQEARETLAEFLHADVEEVQYVTDTTAGMNAVISSLSLSEGDEIIVSDIEHPVGRVPWAYVADRKRLKIKVVPARDGLVHPEDIQHAVTYRTRAISLSHVSFTTGGRIDLSAIGEIARDSDAVFLVDAAQSVGALDLDLSKAGCDAVAFPGYKWCLGPEGSAGLYVNRRVWDKLQPATVSMGSTANRSVDGDYELKEGAGLYAPSTPGLMEILGLSYSLQYLMDLGMDRVEARIQALTDEFICRLGQVAGVTLISPAGFDRRAGLVSFNLPDLDNMEEMRNTTREFLCSGVHIRVVPRPLAFRASFHVFNDEEDVDRLVKLLETACSVG